MCQNGVLNPVKVKGNPRTYTYSISLKITVKMPFVWLPKNTRVFKESFYVFRQVFAEDGNQYWFLSNLFFFSLSVYLRRLPLRKFILKKIPTFNFLTKAF